MLSFPLSLFLFFIEQTLMNIYYVSGTFIGTVNTVVIQIKIVPVPTEPRVYGWGLQNRKYSVYTEKESTVQSTAFSICHQHNYRGFIRLIFFLVLSSESCLEMLSVKMCSFLKTKWFKHTESKLNKGDGKISIISLILAC